VNRDDPVRECRLAAEAANKVEDLFLGLSGGLTLYSALEHVATFSNALDEMRASFLRAMLAAGALSLDRRKEHLRVWTEVIEKELEKTGDPSARAELLLFLSKAGILNRLTRPEGCRQPVTGTATQRKAIR
jgi:hypothetical protein